MILLSSLQLLLVRLSPASLYKLRLRVLPVQQLLPTLHRYLVKLLEIQRARSFTTIQVTKIRTTLTPKLATQLLLTLITAISQTQQNSLQATKILATITLVLLLVVMRTYSPFHPLRQMQF